jgi:hypothetical protein
MSGRLLPTPDPVATPESPSRLVYQDRTLTGAVRLDGATFQRCRFHKAILIYSGGEPPSLEGCLFEDTTFHFTGAAGRTLALLKAMASPSSGLRDVFKASFAVLFGH